MRSLPVQWVARLSEGIPRNPIPIFGVALLLCALALWSLPQLEGEFSPQALFLVDAEEVEYADAFVERFGSQENTLLLVVEGADGVLHADLLDWMDAVEEACSALPFVERSASIASTPIPRFEEGTLAVSAFRSGDSWSADDVQRLSNALNTFHFIEGTLVSPSRRLAVIAVSLDRELRQVAELAPMVDAIAGIIEARPAPPGVTVRLAGLPHIRTHVVGKLIGDQLVLVPLAALLNLVFLFFAFRWLPAVVLPLIAVGGTVLLLVGGMALASEPFNIINNVLPTLVLVIGISDSIHLLNRYREEIAEGHEAMPATVRTLRSMMVACFFTSTTTAVGFASLVVARTEILQRFGLTAALGVMTAYVVTVTFLPAALALFAAPKAKAKRPRHGILERFGLQLHRAVLRTPRLWLVLTVLLLVLAVFSSRSVVIDSTLLEIFDDDDEIYQTTRLLEEELAGVLSFEISLEAEASAAFQDPELLHAAEALAAWVGDQEGVLRTMLWSSWLRDLRVAWTGDPERRHLPFRSVAEVAQLAAIGDDAGPEVARNWVSADRRHLRISVRAADVGGRRMLELSDALESQFATLFPQETRVSMRLTGDNYLGATGLDHLLRDLLASLFTALLIIFAFLVLLFRSLRLAILSFPPNVIPLVVTLGYMGVRGIDLNTTTLLIFSVSLGLAVDNTIHVVSRYREERMQGLALDAALERVVVGTGRAVIVASLLLLCGLSVVLLSSFVPIRLFAELVGVTILSCLVADLIVLPALLHLYAEPVRPDPPPSGGI